METEAADTAKRVNPRNSNRSTPDPRSKVALIEPVHVAVPGRARFRTRGLYRCPALKHTIEHALAARVEVRRVLANPLTGTVLVEFDRQLDWSMVALMLEQVSRQSDGTRAAKGSTARRPHSRSAIAGDGALLKAVRPRSRASLPGHPWHRLTTRAVAEHFGSSEAGLPRELAAERLGLYGPNRLAESEPRSPVRILLDQFNSMPTVLLLAAAGISLLTGALADTLAIGGVIAVNATLGFLTENQSEKAIRSLRQVVRPAATVLRRGQLSEAPAASVVPGDVLVLRPGTYVCADARLLQAEHLSVDESALTGESLPVTKTRKPLRDGALALADRSNMVYMGTLVTGGQGLAMVVATGERTELGLVQRLTGEAQAPETPMERQLAQVGRQLVFACSAVCGVVFAVGLLRGFGLFAMLSTAISLAVASVPEGLPTVAATTLALGMLKMRRHGVIVRKLDAVETLGCVQTICLDKTGTLTLNRMEVARVQCGARRWVLRGGNLFEHGRPLGEADGELRKLAQICVLCSESAIERGAGQYQLTGSSTENALIHLALTVGLEPLALRAGYPMLKMVGRSEKRNFMYTMHTVAGGRAGALRHALLVALKGSPSEVLAMCRWQLQGARRVALSPAERARILAANDQMAGTALRVLGIAYRETAGAENVERDLVWLGLVGMADPLRGGVSQAIEAFHRAGIDTVMITGDQRQTALAIGKELALSRNGALRIFDSARLEELDGPAAQDISEEAQVFARVSPAHKLHIVQALQRAGKVVAMTGDGINDSPALKAADIGIAMGSTGTDAARNVADVVLEHDDLQTMLVAIGEGRTIYRNIRKSLHFVLSTNFSEIIVMFAALAAGLGQPLNAMQLLWINLISDVMPGLALALEPPEPDVMLESPRDPHEPVLKNSDFRRIAGESAALSAGALTVYGYGVTRYGAGAHASTLAFTSLAASQLLHSASCRSSSHSVFSGRPLTPNLYLIGALAVSFGAQSLTLLWPGLRQLLGLTPLGTADGIAVGLGAIAPFIFNEATKQLSFKPAAGQAAN